MITPLPSGEGKGEGPAGEGGVASWGRGRGHLGKEYEPALQLDTNSKGVKAENNN